MIGVKITSLKANQTVPVGHLTIYGTSTDTPETDCKVFVDWNDTKPMQNVTGIGSGGLNDYSNWTFTYTQKYHLITEGTNELTSKISCYGNSANNKTTKYYSISITGSTNAASTTIPTPSGSHNTNNFTANFHGVGSQSLFPQYSGSGPVTPINNSKSVSKVEEPKSNVYIEISSGYSDNKNNNGDKTIKFKTSSSMVSSKSNKTQDERNDFNVNHQDLTRFIHNLIREKLDRISDQFTH